MTLGAGRSCAASAVVWRPARLAAALDRACARCFEHWLEPVLSPAGDRDRLRRARRTRWSCSFQALGVVAGVVGFVFARALYKDGKSHGPARLLEASGSCGAWTGRLQQVLRRRAVPGDGHRAGSLRPGRGCCPGSTAAHRRRSSTWPARSRRLLASVDGAIDTLPRGRRGQPRRRTRTASRSGAACAGVQTGRIQTYLYGALAGAHRCGAPQLPDPVDAGETRLMI